MLVTVIFPLKVDAGFFPFQGSAEVTFELSMGQSNSSVLCNDGPNADRSVAVFKDVPALSRGTSSSSYREGTSRSGIGESYMTESESSFAIFPNFHFNLHDITSLGKLSARKADFNIDLPIQKVSVLAAVLEISGLDVVRVKKGAAAGTEVAVISFVIGDHMGAIVKLTAWRETAENFDGSDGSHPKIKKGDVVFFKGLYYLGQTRRTLKISLLRRSRSPWLDFITKCIPESKIDTRDLLQVTLDSPQ